MNYEDQAYASFQAAKDDLNCAYDRRGGWDRSSILLDSDGDLAAIRMTYTFTSAPTWVLLPAAVAKHGITTLKAFIAKSKKASNSYYAKKGFQQVFIQVAGHYGFTEASGVEYFYFQPDVDAVLAGRFVVESADITDAPAFSRK